MLGRALLAVGLAVMLLTGAFVLLALAVRLSWQQVPPPPEPAAFHDRAGLASRQADGSSVLRLVPQPEISKNAYG